MSTIVAWAGHYAHAGSDKVWAGAVEGPIFRSTWGKRGSALQGGEKAFGTPDLAVAAFTKKQTEKASEGYQEVAFGDPTFGIPVLFDGQQVGEATNHAFVPQGERAVEHAPAHVTKADESLLTQALAHPRWGVSEKLDGERCVCVIKDGTVVAFNSKGQRVSAPPVAAQRLLDLGMDLMVDGERLTRDGTGSYALFDCLEMGGENLRPLPFAERIGRLVQAVCSIGDLLAQAPAATLALDLWCPNALYLLTSEADPDQGHVLVEAVRARGGEGIILRDLDGPYVAGDTKHITKCKFVSDLEAFCLRVTPGVATGSVTLGLVRPSDGRIFEVCNVRSGLRDADLAVLGACIERGERPVLSVNYLGARSVGLKLVEPRTDMTRLREDRTWQDCVIGQMGPAKVALFAAQYPEDQRDRV
jgi:predicted DNA-binding WGR domain protein